MTDLAELVADALSSMPADKAEAIAKHPDTPGAVEKIRAALGTGTRQDVMSTNEQRAAKDAGVDTIAHPNNSAPNSSPEVETAEARESRIRNQAISDMAVAAGKERETANSKDSSALSTGMIEGLVDMAAHGMKSKLKELSTYATELSAAVKSANSKGK